MSRSLLSVGTQRKEQWTVPVWSAMFKLGFLQSLGPPLGCSSAKLPFSVMAGNLAGPWSSAATDMFCSSTAGEGAKAPPRWTALGQPHTSPPMQGGGTGLQAKVQHLSQNGYRGLSLSLYISLSLSLYISLSLSLSIHPSIHPSIHAHVHVHVHLHLHVHIHIHIHIQHIRAHIHIHIHIHIHVHLYICTSVHLYICTSVHIYIYTYIHIYIYTYRHIYIYTYIRIYVYTYTYLHIYIYIQILSLSLSSLQSRVFAAEPGGQTMRPASLCCAHPPPLSQTTCSKT